MTRLTEEMIMARAKQRDVGTLKILNMWGNELDNVYVLRKLQNVEVLALSVNRISTLKDFVCCIKLQELYLRKNKISDLSELEYLQCLPDLRSLWLEDNPCVELSGAHYRYMVLRYLPKLEKLDNKDVTKEERNLATKLDEIVETKHEEKPIPAATVAPPENAPSTSAALALSARRQAQIEHLQLQQQQRPMWDPTAREERKPTNNRDERPIKPACKKSVASDGETPRKNKLSESSATLAGSGKVPETPPPRKESALKHQKRLACDTMSLNSTRDIGETLTSCQSTPLLRVESNVSERPFAVAKQSINDSLDCLVTPATSRHISENNFQLQIDTARSEWTDQDDYGSSDTVQERETRDMTVQTDDISYGRRGCAGTGCTDTNQPYVFNHEFCYFRQRPTDRNAKVLAATLCLLKELDFNSLSVVEQLVHCRLDELANS